MKKYYYLKGQQKMGPYTIEELAQEHIERNTWVWFQGLDKWMQLKDIEELREVWSSLPPPISKNYSDGYQGTQPNTGYSNQSSGYGNQSAGYENQSAGYGSQNSGSGRQTESFLKPPRPKSWLTESILVTLFCCLPFGIVGIVYASKVESRYNTGDYDGSSEAAAEAKKWTMIGFWIGLAVTVIYGIIMLTTASAVFNSSDF